VLDHEPMRGRRFNNTILQNVAASNLKNQLKGKKKKKGQPGLAGQSPGAEKNAALPLDRL